MIHYFNVIMPMLGSGSRMEKVQKTCKPLMLLPNGEYFFMKALSSLKKYSIDILTLVVLPEYEDEFIQLQDRIKAVSNCRLLRIISHMPTGTPVQSALAGYDENSLSMTSLPLFILDCDIYGEIPYREREAFSAKIFWFESDNPNKSFIVTQQNSRYVTEIAEKIAISNKAVFGAYLFAPGMFAKFAKPEMKYISDVVKEILGFGEGLLVSSAQVSNVKNFGTLQEYKELIGK